MLNTRGEVCSLWRGSLLPLGGEAAPNPFAAVLQIIRGARFATASQPSGSKLPRHKSPSPLFPEYSYISPSRLRS
ncbi:hypothetical protein C1Y11_22555 [Pseudomonas sp. FW305-20]|nr:hypothetical protein C1Y11_22555 [Pseudomonas sp. FW305-20]PMU17632.1 hypothetical protein C1Y10_15430 [Pseudomonas sp. FW305-122]PMU35152.1 hypothetical protein C1Y12_26025 [Pseudomonas sp. FW305-47B]PMX58282.1 hypothetical protein C1Y13_21340 [Pseudomonas sp. FW305-33]PMX66836.1 hypothetical protein C1X12_15545 [Pseudomonas sp. FW305-60]